MAGDFRIEIGAPQHATAEAEESIDAGEQDASGAITACQDDPGAVGRKLYATYTTSLVFESQQELAALDLPDTCHVIVAAGGEQAAVR